ncbi:zinc finger protein Xfin [Scaptodrosophila lebanonensis]|uniref:Zinc finger protein Xfin n=1 Tax=Drosophila lebanonensis TaxID=7225 RepID=A0A6J2TIS5_DROLE|nr:zinc finger protein Xfin [Scaptodrosophila lebanonensis]
MEGMDLWTSMFSSDFVEGENSLNEQFGDIETDLGNSNGKTFPVDEDDGGDGEEKRKAKNVAEPDDDAIFDFELEPIVSIAEPSPLPPPPPASASIPMQRQSLPASLGSSMSMTRPKELRMSVVPMRPTTSQINATDENGIPINYELGVIYICPACGSEYRQQDLWKRHMNQSHQYNTRRGLNFVAIDKLYHRCLECNKHIAMHSRENLLKHKFTHLPFRCTKCYICKREYKYRQDLMVHLRMTHCDEVVAMMRSPCQDDYHAGKKTRVREPQTEDLGGKKRMYDDEEDDNIEVKNEVLEPDMDEPTFGLSTFIDDEQSRSSSQASNKKKRNATASGANGGGTAADICEDYIHYMCPECATECDTQAQWSQHIEFVHDFVSRRGLNFRSVDMQMQCIECNKFVQPNTIKALRQHKFSHLPHQEWLRCKLCYKGYAEHHLLVDHLLKKHNLETLVQDDVAGGDGEGDGEVNDNVNDLDDDSQLQNWDLPRRGGRHISADDFFEPHIDYLCPQCGKEFQEKKQWRTHVVRAHDMNDLSKLNFEVINDRQLKCTECDKIITNAYGIQNAQQHRITHLPHKAFARCRKCFKSYTDRKGLVKHLATYHRVGYEPRKMATPSTLPPVKQPRKQIVTVANETYEIIYLDDEGSPPPNEDNDFGEQMQADEEDYTVMNRDTATNYSRSYGSASPNRYKCVDCGSLFSTQVALKTHISEEHDFMEKLDSSETAEPAVSSASGRTIEQNYIFLCPSCGEEYKTQFEWRRHINEAHNFDKRQYLNMRQLDKYRYQCTVCRDIVCNSKLKGLQDHHFRHLPYRLYLKCLVCGTCYNHKPNIAAHLRTRHNIIESQPSERELHAQNRLLKDPVPESSTSIAVAARTLKPNPGQLPMRPAGLNTLEDSISYHNAVDLDFITYYCPKCNKNFDSHAFWRKHIVEQHNYNSREGLNFRQIDNHHYLCLECYKRVTVTHTKGAIGQLQSHKFRHLPYRSFKCLTCSGEFVRKQMFFKHLNRDTNRCDTQPRSSTDEPCAGQELEQEKEQPSSVVEADDDTDVNPNTYQLLCPQCGDEFTTKALWREHINIFHGLGKRETLCFNKIGEALYKCTECEETLETNKVRVLQQHRFKHLPYPAYIRCELCQGGKCMNSMRVLQHHMREKHPSLAEDEAKMQMLRDDDEEDSIPPNDGPYMPLPPHLLDDVNDIDFDEQYLLG